MVRLRGVHFGDKPCYVELGDMCLGVSILRAANFEQPQPVLSVGRGRESMIGRVDNVAPEPAGLYSRPFSPVGHLHVGGQGSVGRIVTSKSRLISDACKTKLF